MEPAGHLGEVETEILQSFLLDFPFLDLMSLMLTELWLSFPEQRQSHLNTGSAFFHCLVTLYPFSVAFLTHAAPDCLLLGPPPCFAAGDFFGRFSLDVALLTLGEPQVLAQTFPFYHWSVLSRWQRCSLKAIHSFDFFFM